MKTEGARMLAIWICLPLIIAPFFLGFALKAAARRWVLDLRPIYPLIKALRWTAWISGAVLWVIHLTGPLFRGEWAYGMALIAFSIGLSFPERWLKERLAQTESPDNSGPSSGRELS
jgi:hypothetical protein